MLTLTEHVQIETALKLFEGEQTEFTEEQLAAAEFFDLTLNPVSLNTELTLYDVSANALASVEFEDADMAIAFVQELFDIDEEDDAWIGSYEWATNFEDRRREALADDGTSVP